MNDESYITEPLIIKIKTRKMLNALANNLKIKKSVLVDKAINEYYDKYYKENQ